MSTIDRRTWLREALEVRPAGVSSIPTGMDFHECDAWIPDCERWMKMHCSVDLRACQSVGSLHAAFCEWTVRNGSVPCRRDVFEKLMERLEVSCIDGFSQGLILTADLRVLKEGVKN